MWNVPIPLLLSLRKKICSPWINTTECIVWQNIRKLTQIHFRPVVVVTPLYYEKFTTKYDSRDVNTPCLFVKLSKDQIATKWPSGRPEVNPRSAGWETLLRCTNASTRRCDPFCFQRWRTPSLRLTTKVQRSRVTYPILASRPTLILHKLFIKWRSLRDRRTAWK